MSNPISESDSQSISTSSEKARVYYLSGPMAGYPELNYPAFECAANELRIGWGFTVISPNELTPPTMDPKMEGLDFLAWDIHIMTRDCNAIILLKGWPASKGARAELEVALTLKWPVFYYDRRRLISMQAN